MERFDYEQQLDEDRRRYEEETPLQTYRADLARDKEWDEKDRAFMKIWRKAWKDWADKEKR